jgi:predicted nucleic acid-binding protein
MDQADGWFMCRIGFVETVRALRLAAGARAASSFTAEWPMFGVIEVDQRLAERAAQLTDEFELRSLDGLHLAAALLLPSDALVVATWDRRLHTAAGARGLQLLPTQLN